MGRFRYEGVYMFCKRCGRIGHKSSACSQSWTKVKSGIEKAIVEACKPEAPIMFDNPNASLYSNKIIGLPHTSKFITTQVKLNEPRRPSDISSSSSSSDNDDDENQMNDQEMRNASTNNDPSSKSREMQQ